MAEADLLQAARSGDDAAFVALVAPYRRELHVHCYRMLGSFDDADDAMQEVLLATWRSLPSFQSRASVRTWLYTVATNICLNLIRTASRRPQMTDPLPAQAPEPTGSTEVTWLQPYPDLLLDELPDPNAAPGARIERAEAVSLAFLTALQLLSPRARAVLVLRDVLGFSAVEVAGTLDSTPEAVAMMLSRARTALREHAPTRTTTHGPAGTADEARLVGLFTQALVAHDVDAVVRLLAADVRVAMPPLPAVWQGRDRAATFLVEVAFRLVPRARFVQTRANGQPALGVYTHDAADGLWRGSGLLVLTLDDARITGLTRFESATMRPFGLPGILPDDQPDK